VWDDVSMREEIEALLAVANAAAGFLEDRSAMGVTASLRWPFVTHSRKISPDGVLRITTMAYTPLRKRHRNPRHDDRAVAPGRR
jgi:hypothetical protein